MKNKKTLRILFSITFLIFFLFGCRTLKEKDFRTNSALSTILPNLNGKIDVDNLKKNISYGRIKISGHYFGVINIMQNIDSLKSIMVDKDINLINTNKKSNQDSDSLIIIIFDEQFNLKRYRFNPEGYYTKAEFIPEERIEDFIKLFAKELKKQGTPIDTSLIGNIQFDLISFKEKRSLPLIFFSAWTICVPTLIGFPLTRIKSSLEIQLTILNRHDEIIGTYNGKGIGKAFVAMYWGYGKDAWRKSALQALTNAMDSVKINITKDKVRLNTELLKK